MTSAMETRFKRYEAVSDPCLIRRTPVIGRLDGRAFHTLTAYCQKPFDVDFHMAMIETMAMLCKEIQGCKLAYMQSDEISLLITDYDTIQTEPWFGYRVNKMTSIAASVASVAFSKKWERTAHFDARFFNLPENDVCNYFLYRQRDAERNSVNALAQSLFSQKELQGKSVPQMHDMMHEKGVNWNDCEPRQKRGVVMYNDEQWGWLVPWSTPEFSKDREYVEKFMRVTE